MGDPAYPRTHIGMTERDNRRCYFVRDNGIGTATDCRELVFGLFERLSRDVDGNGVGLALVKRIIKVHGGEVGIESDGPVTDTEVFFTLSDSQKRTNPFPTFKTRESP